MISWTDSIPIGTGIDSVKKIQPGFIEIDWSNPQVNGNEYMFSIKRIRGSRDRLQMENYLSFVDKKYRGRFARKWACRG